MGGNNVVGYYPGSGMRPEGGNWFFYTYQTRALSFQIVNWCGPSDWQGRVVFRYTINLDSTLMKFPSGTNELWIVIPDTTQLPLITNRPPAGNKVVYFLSPWDIGAPLVQFDGLASIKMKMDTSIALCGWFKYYYYGKPADARAKFINSLDSTVYSSAGTGNGNFIDLSGVLASSDTAWVLPVPLPNGPPSVSRQYPNQSAPCQRSLLLGAMLRDIDGSTHPDFNVGGTKPACDGPNRDYNGATLGIVMPRLDANGKPVVNPASICPVDRFDWFTTQTIVSPYTNAVCYNLRLTKNDDGLFQYDTAYFYPLDSFKFLDPAGTIPNPWWTPGTDDKGFQHNYSFTMELGAQFEYKKGQTFYFRGDDDVWVFINNILAVDIGGIHNPVEGLVKLDTIGQNNGTRLVVGQTYSFKLFFSERNCCGSNFRMVTSLNLRTSSNLFTTQTFPGGGVRQYTMFEKISQSNLSCDYSQSVIDTQPAVVDFFLTGPQNVPFVQPMLLPMGTSYGGITIQSGNTIVRIDTTAITELPPGDYLISYALRSDKSQTGTIPFTINSLPPDHFDILIDSMTLDLKKDAVVDSIVINMLDSTTQIYSVIRDVLGLYLKRAASPTWTSRDPQVVTAAQSPTDPSRCIITKAGAGVTWVVVSDPAGKLKSDSVKIVTHVLPKYPVIFSAIMLDTNADIIPDMLSITLNDTFKTNQRLDSIIIAYRGNNYSIPAANALVSATSINVPFASLSGTNARPSGQVTIAITVDDGPHTSSKAFIDGVGPAVIAADVMENDGSGPDTLFVTFSEPMQQSSLAGNQLLLIKAGAADTLSFNILQVLAKTNDSTFTLQVTSPGQQPKGSDRLRLLPGSRGGTLIDQARNAPHDLNRSVVLGLRLGPPAVIASYYRDGNADGFIDTVVMAFKRPVQASEIQMMSVRWSWSIQSKRVDTVPLPALKKLTDSIFCIPVHGETLTPKMVRTNVGMELLAAYTNFPDLPPHWVIVDDSAAPVLDSARLVYKNPPDTTVLRVVFSENVQQPGNHPFSLLSRKFGAQYQFRLTPVSTSGAVCIFHVDAIEGGTVAYAGTGDSIWINSSDAPPISDILGSAQRNPLNRRVALDVEIPAPDWVCLISKNPFVAGTGTLAEISAFPKAPLIDVDQYSLKISIFDIIGNMVIARPMAQKDKNVAHWAYSWDGRNRSGRLVGAGVYSGIIRVFYGSELALTKRIRIGVKR
jgi:fibro-slime domain-containing protein